MRTIQLVVHARPPRKTERSWLRFMDRVEAMWAFTGRKRLGGRVGVGYTWFCPDKLSLKDEARIGIELASRMGFAIKDGARTYLAGARAEEAKPPARVILTLEGE